MLRFLKYLFGFGFLIGINLLFALGIGFSVMYRKLPPIDALLDYRPKLPMQIYAADGTLHAEFGVERRELLSYSDFPPMLIQALLATEDVRFFEHSGVDFIGLIRAVYATSQGRTQGASTITMQLARNFFLSREQLIIRKLYEILLAIQVEQALSKREILQTYMNQVYLGQSSFGFVSAAQTYFNKNLDELTPAEIAVLVGLLKAPSALNPIASRKNARDRQLHVLERMYATSVISEQAYQESIGEPLPNTVNKRSSRIHAHSAYATEEIRKLAFSHLGEESYEQGLQIQTTIDSKLQHYAYEAVLLGLVNHQKRRGYLGPEAFFDIDTQSPEQIAAHLKAYPDVSKLEPAIVIASSQKKVEVLNRKAEVIALTADQIKHVRNHLPGGKKQTIVSGALVRLYYPPSADLKKPSLPEIVSIPQAQAALVVLSPDDGAILAMVGGLDFNRNEYNHATQAKRQPGSSLKPFIYSAALEKGVMPSTIIYDAPLFLSAAETGSNKSWEPKNYDGKFSGPISSRLALAKSKNLATVQLLRLIGVNFAHEHLQRFGFSGKENPPYLTMALGAGSASVLEMARAYAVFVNGGYFLSPFLVKNATDFDGNNISVNFNFSERRQVISERNAYLTTTMLQDVVKLGTGRGLLSLRRNDLGGKTGTTNDTIDAWFSGFGGNLVAVSWIGYSQPKSLGYKETGGRAALPIWRHFMRKALENQPQVEFSVPEGLEEIKIIANTGEITTADNLNGVQSYIYEEHLPSQAPTSTAERLAEDDLL